MDFSTSSGPMAPPPRKRKPKAPTLRDADWEPVKERVLELIKNLPLSGKGGKDGVREVMSTEFGFEATERQYKFILNKWNVGKNVRREEMKAIVRKRTSRIATEPDKPAQVFQLRGQIVPEEKITRFVERESISLEEVYAPSCGAPTPAGDILDCWTPRPDNDPPTPLSPVKDIDRNSQDSALPTASVSPSSSTCVLHQPQRPPMPFSWDRQGLGPYVAVYLPEGARSLFSLGEPMSRVTLDRAPEDHGIARTSHTLCSTQREDADAKAKVLHSLIGLFTKLFGDQPTLLNSADNDFGCEFSFQLWSKRMFGLRLIALLLSYRGYSAFGREMDSVYLNLFCPYIREADRAAMYLKASAIEALVKDLEDMPPQAASKAVRRLEEVAVKEHGPPCECFRPVENGVFPQYLRQRALDTPSGRDPGGVTYTIMKWLRL